MTAKVFSVCWRVESEKILGLELGNSGSGVYKKNGG
jgi:hypothetical protein